MWSKGTGSQEALAPQRQSWEGTGVGQGAQLQVSVLERHLLSVLSVPVSRADGVHLRASPFSDLVETQ